MNFQQEITSAIQNHKKINITYENNLDRTAEPYILYQSSTGKILLDAYQTGGYSESGQIQSWKRFDVTGIDNLQVIDETFEVRMEYNPSNSNRYRYIISKI